MKFKIDENLPVDVAQLLREAGHDVYSVHEQGLVGAKDQVLAEVCRSETRAMVTSEDRHQLSNWWESARFQLVFVAGS